MTRTENTAPATTTVYVVTGTNTNTRRTVRRVVRAATPAAAAAKVRGNGILLDAVYATRTPDAWAPRHYAATGGNLLAR